MTLAETEQKAEEAAPDGRERMALLDELRRRIAAIERRPARFGAAGNMAEGTADGTADHPAASAWRFGLADLDEALKSVMAGPAGLHEIAPAAPGDAAAAAGFALALAVRLLAAADGRQGLLWCQQAYDRQERGRLYGPGLAALGLDPAALLLVRARREQDLLWALEEGLRSHSLTAVIGEAAPRGTTPLRRLSLAAAESDTPVLLLPQTAEQAAGQGGSFLTRWRIAAAPSALPAQQDKTARDAPGRSRWRLELTRCRGGRPGAWTLEWDHETGCFALAAALADRPAAPTERRPTKSWPKKHRTDSGLAQTG